MEDERKFVGTHERLSQTIDRLLVLENKLVRLVNKIIYLEGNIEILKQKFKTHANTFNAQQPKSFNL